MNIERCSGVLLHITSLPSKYGIGDLGPAAYAFVDRLLSAGQKVWQILPLGPTGYGDSPYAAFSSFAGNELLIDIEALWKDGLLLKRDIQALEDRVINNVAYGPLIEKKTPLLRKAAAAFLKKRGNKADYLAFIKTEAAWLDDYALFRSIKAVYDLEAVANGREFSIWNLSWPESLKRRHPSALPDWRQGHAAEIEAIKVQQYFFYRQWEALKAYANRRGISIVGDLPIFTAMDSSDVWAAPGLFMLDEAMMPRKVAGVPPDYFSADGQLWGNPLYDWPAHQTQSFAWWISRIEHALRLYNFVRIDHFRGFEAYWAVPYLQKTARVGEWQKAPGQELFRTLQAKLGDNLPIIAEDLGLITEEVRQLRDGFKLPGMKILQFAFGPGPDGRSFDDTNVFLPHNYPENCIVYTGTHDNDTLVGKYKPADEPELAFIQEYLGYKPKDICSVLVRESLRSVARLAIIPLQDILEAGKESRMNIPSTLGGNWIWRMKARDLKDKAWDRLRSWCKLYSR
ncbi:MAG: 4-alpha-glucanotransferase [Spirochaetes bacterium GWD1_61_31]|nr:MAG: 4-alpha-glucanotransferase [Spirochaetes bacterium GWB1_60_80]OHD33320.1 MAG: 4-alpha-glucanotransferase [Spirochaetes bacterium GWC1_61_12]OHD34552.1 MAG: 4-alpha-glucanotransferase [Spirochaetes bacterium GWD1_61_31]OHD41559.1 MAG: 4-alpha-glucanotransferase [Spirochaetes bacterium GWE1_60_18]OHD61463.1 MAG: 4-alpha-glucanotransferase [Spirochaetes bacterium GWF1_60_12]HAP43377.1 4-alpha-glucanotransferase [Spirochaetaceae bacterium]